MTGRISDFIPFLPFSPGEQAVIVYKFLLELIQKAKNPVSLLDGKHQQLLGNVNLSFRPGRDATVCGSLASTDYSSELGARSLRNAVKQVEDKLVAAYLEEEDEIFESQDVQDFEVDAKGDEIVVYRKY